MKISLKQNSSEIIEPWNKKALPSEKDSALHLFSLMEKINAEAKQGFLMYGIRCADSGVQSTPEQHTRTVHPNLNSTRRFGQTKDYRGSILETYLKKLGKLNSLQQEVLIGLMLGDGNLSVGKIGKNCSLKYDQKITHSSLVNLVYLIFEPFVGSPPSIRYKNKVEHSLWFRTFRLPQLFFYYGQFYGLNANGQRIRGIPKLLHRWITPISLAFWFMDDGSKAPYGYMLHTENFLLTECKYLQQLLGKKFGLEVTIHSDTRPKTNSMSKTYYKLYIRASSRSLFTKLISPYIIPSMRYKLHLN